MRDERVTILSANDTWVYRKLLKFEYTWLCLVVYCTRFHTLTYKIVDKIVIFGLAWSCNVSVMIDFNDYVVQNKNL